MSFKERILEEAYGESSLKSKLKTATGLGTAGAIGYGFGTGGIQKVANHVWNQPLSQTAGEIKTGVTDLFHKAADVSSHTTLGDVAEKAGEGIGNFTSRITHAVSDLFQ